MKTNQAAKIIKYIGEIESHDFHWLRYAKTIPQNLFNTIHHQQSTWNHKTLNEITTYQDCTHTTFSTNDKNKIIMSIDVFNGDNLYGQPTDLNTTFSLYITKITPELEKLINNYLTHTAVNIIQQQDYQAMQRRIQITINQILQDLE